MPYVVHFKDSLEAPLRVFNIKVNAGVMGSTSQDRAGEFPRHNYTMSAWRAFIGYGFPYSIPSTVVFFVWASIRKLGKDDGLAAAQ